MCFLAPHPSLLYSLSGNTLLVTTWATVLTSTSGFTCSTLLATSPTIQVTFYKLTLNFNRNDILVCTATMTEVRDSERDQYDDLVWVKEALVHEFI